MSMQKDPEWVEVHHLQQFVNLSGKHVLEVGCGEGRLTWRYAGIARRVTAFDPDGEALKNARQNCPVALQKTVRLVRASALALPHPKDTFDLAFLTWSL